MMTTTTQFRQVSLSLTRRHSTQRTSLAQIAAHNKTTTTIRPSKTKTTTNLLSMRHLELIQALVDSRTGRLASIIKIHARLHPHLLSTPVFATVTTWHRMIVLAALRTRPLDLMQAHWCQWEGPKQAFRLSRRSLALEVATAGRLHALREVG